MPTPAERRALAFLAGLGLLGSGVRMASSEAPAAPPASGAQPALESQIAAVARREREQKRGEAYRSDGRRKRSKARDTMAAGVRRAAGVERPTEGPIDLDVATAAELDRLPGIGPALAARIVANRDSLGPFGSLAELDRVRGIGPALCKRLQPIVRFTGVPRPRPAGTVTRGGGPTRRRSVGPRVAGCASA